MSKIKIGVMVFALCMAYGLNAGAQPISRSEYQVAKKNISAEYKADKNKCDSLAGNAKDICMEEAKGKEKAAKAELNARHKPSRKAANEVSVAKAKADYEVAKEKCDDKVGNDKSVCMKEAKAAFVEAKSTAKAQMETSKAKATAHEKSSEANLKAKEKGREAHQEAAADRTDANYAVAKEKCKAMAGDAKDRCMSEAKIQYEK